MILSLAVYYLGRLERHFAAIATGNYIVQLSRGISNSI